ncbi:MAG: TIGR03086 family protein [Actinobacteria bacterium]|nr:TIGR03086 family protein [Actinomycetota bacterium]
MTKPDVAAASTRRVTQLIELGRDREAVELARAQAGSVGDDGFQTRGGAMDVLSQLDELGPLLASVVGEISPDQLDNPTPCAAFTVRGVLEHMIGGATMFAAGFRGAEPITPDTTDVLVSFGPALSGLAEAMHAPGALERTIQAPFGEAPGETFARFVVLDGLVHGFDLATAIGQAYEPPDALVAEVEAFAREALTQMRDGDTFAEPVEPPASATPIERLAAFTGRRL